MTISRVLTALACATLPFSVSAIPSPRTPVDVHGGLVPENHHAGPAPSMLLSRSTADSCPVPVDIPTVAKKPTPFSALTDEETSSVVTWLYLPEQQLNLTNSSDPTLAQSDNYIWLVEALLPNKTDVLAYLDQDAPAPDRYARVVINEGGKAEPDVTEYYVSL